MSNMTVGQYAEVELQDPADTWRHGGVFLLRKPAMRDATVSLDGWTTAVVNGGKAVITCGLSNAKNFGDAFSEARAAANNGLDYMCATGMAHCAIINAEDESLVWWPQRRNGGVVMRATVNQTFAFSFSAHGVVKDAHGNVVAPPAPLTPKIHDAFRFLRMCKTSDDLFDSYRNLFLAFESLLSDIRPRQRRPTSRWRRLLRLKPDNRWETETVWFTEALGEADKLVSLARLTPPDVQNHKKWIREKMYGRERSALMHAKLGHDYLLPQDETRRAELVVSLSRLWDYLKELIAKHLNVTSPAGYLAVAGWAMMADPTLRSAALFVSDDESPVNPLGLPVIAEDSIVVELQSGAPAVISADAFLRTVLGGCDIAELQALDAIRKFGARNETEDGRAMIVSELTGPLRLGDSVTRFELLFGLRNVSASAAPRIFTT